VGFTYAELDGESKDNDFTESPYLVHQLSMSDDRQHVMGLPGTMLGEASTYVELDGESKDNDVYWYRSLK
jgi:hypothetical protein